MTTLPGANLVVSFVISTHNRRDILLRTLACVYRCGLPRDSFEILVVDNASKDNTFDAVASRFPGVHLFRSRRNLGSCAKNLAIRMARGRYVVFLDDDSFPHPGSVARMIQYFEADPQLGAAVFNVNLLDGSQECSAYPDVFIGCGTGFRAGALTQVGLLPSDFFMQAEEYDLSIRLLAGGWRIRRFDDLHVTHLKTPTARRSWRTMRLDVRNNFMVAMRYFPKSDRRRFLFDWMGRYWRIAAAKGQRLAFVVGLLQGIDHSLLASTHRPISRELFDRFTRLGEIEELLGKLRWQHEVKSVLFLDYGKNIPAYWTAARRCGIDVVAIADDRLAGCRPYHGVPVVNDTIARRLDFDLAIVSNSSPVHAAARMQQWMALDDRRAIDPLAIPTRPVEEASSDYLPARKKAALAA